MCAGAPKWTNTCKLQYFKKIAASAAEAETGGCFVTGRDVIIQQKTLEEMVQPQPITQVCKDNTAASIIENNTIKQQQSRATNMRYFLIFDPKTLKFSHCKKAGQENLAGYFTKNHSAKHHKCVRPIYIQKDKTLWSVPLVLLKPALQGCVHPADYKMEEFRKTLPILQIAGLREDMKRTTDRKTIERNRT